MHDPYSFATRSNPTCSTERPRLFVCLATFALALTLSTLVEAQGLNLTGRWTPPSDSWGHMGVHMALLRGDANHHSKILSWEFKDGATGSLRGWNPSEHGCATYPASQFQVLPLDVNVPGIFCSGHSSLATGELMIAGGTDVKVHIGERRNIIFRPNPGPGQSQWSPPGVMNAGRYYPTNTTLPDGNVLVTSGERFWHMLVFGGTEAPQDPASATRKDINRLGLNSNGQWDPTITQQGAEPWPDAREGHSAVWNANQVKMIVFGGRGSDGPRRDAWLLQVTSTIDSYQYTWSPIPDAPGKRTRHGAILLSNLNNRMIVYGGRDENSQPRSDVWELKLVPPNDWQWAQLATTGISPGARYAHAVAYDQDNNRMLVFGGLTTGDASFADDKVYALTFDPNGVNAPAWSELNPGAGPAAREGHSFVVDPAPRTGGPFGGTARRMVLFGGRTAAGGSQNDVWELWTHPTTGQVQWRSAPLVGGPPPAGRSRHAAMWDGVLDRMIVFGGSSGTSASAEAWALKWNASSLTWSWSPLESQPSSALAGHTAVFNPAIIWSKDPELFSPSSGSWQLQNSPRKQPYYPFMFVVPSGNLFYAGSSFPTFLYKRNVTPPVWQQFPNTNSLFAGGSAVMFRPGEIMKSGRDYDESCFVGGQTAKIKIDANDTSTGWVTSTNTMKVRTFHNLTVLPTGKVLVTGGTENCVFSGDETANPSVREPELWDPDAGPQQEGAWSGLGVLASDPARRSYHSTAILLPDGRVLSAGGESRSTSSAFWDRATIFCPPYLFNADGSLATRPVIGAVHDTIGYNQAMWICTPDVNTIDKVCLIRPGAVTHSFNQDQRYVPLTFTRYPSLGRVEATAPLNANHAPPGDYLLFIVNSSGVPSIAKWVRVRTGGMSAAPECPGDGGGGCPVVDTRTAAGWEEENTILGRSLSGNLVVDSYRLKSVPAIVGRRYQLRVRENEQEHTILDHVRLAVVDHDPGQRAYALGEQVVLATRTPPHRVTTSRGTDVTRVLDGSGSSYFVGEPGETLLVELVDRAMGVQAPTPDIDPFEIDPGEKGGGGGGMMAPGLESMGANADAVALNSSGILIQGRDSNGVWRTVRERRPREHFAEFLVDTLDEGPVRLVFVGRHKLRFVGRVLPSHAVIPVSLPLLAAQHTRFGDVRLAVVGSEGTATTLDPGDTLALEFAVTPVAPGQVRDFFLVSRGAYSSERIGMEEQSQRAATLPSQFALLQSRPNPFAQTTRIGFELPRAVRVRIEVFDLQGRLVRRLADGPYQPGQWSVEWDRRTERGRRARAATYLYRMVAGEFREQKKMTLLP
jgi:hypothetical protein